MGNGFVKMGYKSSSFPFRKYRIFDWAYRLRAVKTKEVEEVIKLVFFDLLEVAHVQ